MASETKWFSLDGVEKDKEEVQDEIMEMIEESEQKDEDEAYRCVAEGSEHIEAVMDQEPEHIESVEEPTEILEEVEVELVKAVDKVLKLPVGDILINLEPAAEKPNESKPHKRMDTYTLKRLRELDRHFNRTCSVCYRRKPIAEFRRGKKGDICAECRES